MSYFGATGTPVLDFRWIILYVSKPESVLPYLHCKGDVMYIPWDPPLVLYIANLWTTALRGIDRVHILPNDITGTSIWDFFVELIDLYVESEAIWGENVPSIAEQFNTVFWRLI